MNEPSAHNTIVYLPDTNFYKLLELVTRATGRHQDGGWQTRLRAWREQIDEDHQAIRLSSQTNSPRRLDDMTFIEHAITHREFGGWQKHAYRIFAGMHPRFTDLQILPRPVRPTQLSMQEQGDMKHMRKRKAHTPNISPQPHLEVLPAAASQNKAVVAASLPAEPKAPETPSVADQLAALLANHTKVGHKFVQMMINPEWADAMMARNFDNRLLRKGKVAIIARAMVEARWAPTPESVKFDINGILRDGQHRLSAVIQSGATVPMTVVFGCDPAECDFYDQGTPRSVADIAREHGHANAVVAQSLVALIMRIELEDNTVFDRVAQTERLEELFGGDPLFETAIKAGKRLRFLIPPTAAAMAYWTIAHKSSRNDRLETFWDALVSGADLPARSPVLRLREFIRDKRNLPGRTSRESAVKIVAAVILAWNAVMTRRLPSKFTWDFTIRLPEVE